MIELDDTTIRQAARKDEAAFRRLYNHYAPFIWKVVYKTMKGDQALAADVVQETFVRLHGALRSFSGGCALSTWIYRIAFNLSMDFLQKARRFELLRNDLGAQSNRSDGMDRMEMNDLINKALGDLTAEERFLLTAREVSGFSFDELAQITKQKSGALRTRLHRMKSQIRERLACLDRMDAPVLADSKGGGV